jgi:hypothetical protein
LIGADNYNRAFHSQPLGIPAVFTIAFYITCALIAGFIAWKASANWAKRFLGEDAIHFLVKNSSGEYASAWNDYGRLLNRFYNWTFANIKLAL